MLRNIPPVTKNLLLLNIMFYIVSIVLAQNGTDISRMLGAHYFNSIFFEPYQIVTHMFMHSISDFFHILFNMLLLVMFGAHLERIWGAKRYFIFYIACGLGAIVLYNSIGMYQIAELRNILSSEGFDLTVLDNKLFNENFEAIMYNPESNQLTYIQQYINLNFSTLVGASGAIFGLLAGFALLFPNTELMLLFPPIPIKAKYLIGGYLVFEIYSSIYRSGDQIAHLAHVGGAVVGIIIILIWRKRDRTNFY